MNLCTAVIVGHKQWKEYTLPLILSLKKHWPGLPIVLVDNDSDPPYPKHKGVKRVWANNLSVAHALNVGLEAAPPSRWYLTMDNDVLCLAPFRKYVEEFDEWTTYAVEMKAWPPFSYLIGWAWFISDRMYRELGPLDEGYLYWGWQEVDYCYRAVLEGYLQQSIRELPFQHFGHKSWHFVKDREDWGRKNEKRFREKFKLCGI